MDSTDTASILLAQHLTIHVCVSWAHLLVQKHTHTPLFGVGLLFTWQVEYSRRVELWSLSQGVFLWSSKTHPEEKCQNQYFLNKSNIAVNDHR